MHTKRKRSLDATQFYFDYRRVRQTMRPLRNRASPIGVAPSAPPRRVLRTKEICCSAIMPL